MEVTVNNDETLMRPGQRIAPGQSEKATRKRADLELKPPVGESAAESAGRPLLAHCVIAQFPPCRLEVWHGKLNIPLAVAASPAGRRR
jgi:hypothetical protein